jgi:peptidoglycan-N-acetylglucosamine deacetylase
MRRPTRHRSDRRPLPYAVNAVNQSRRARPRWRWTAALVATVLLVLAGIAGVVASATGGTGQMSRYAPARASAAGSRARVRRPGPRHALPGSPLAAAQRAIGRVLAYTPFVARGTPRRRLIALTFDDGPSPYTGRIVQILAREHAPATFFIVGQQLADFAAGLRDELRHGFEVGDHTQNHASLIRLSRAGQYAQIHAAAAQMKRLGAPFPDLFRPPYGAFNAQTFATLHRLGMLMVLWSIDPGDWRRPGTNAIVSGVLSAARPGGIIELHDGGGDRSQTVAALPKVIDGLRRRHYQLVTVGQLLAADPPPRHQPRPVLAGA